MIVIAGLLIGVIAGTVQFLLLSRFTREITGGGFSARGIIYGILQFMIPFAVLFGCAFLLRRELLWAGVGMVASLIVGAVITVVRSRVKRGK